MQIQVNGPQQTLPRELVEFIEERTGVILAPHAEKLTRVEVYLQDLNADKGGVDKRCSIEARPRGLNPIAASHDAASGTEAFRGAIQKLDRALTTRFGRLDARGR